MVIATGARVGGGKLILLGLSKENVRRLLDDQPIKKELDGYGVGELSVIIFADEDEETMARKLATLIGPDTKMVRDGY